jgi:hypothetical protein
MQHFALHPVGGHLSMYVHDNGPCMVTFGHLVAHHTGRHHVEVTPLVFVMHAIFAHSLYCLDPLSQVPRPLQAQRPAALVWPADAVVARLMQPQQRQQALS